MSDSVTPSDPTVRPSPETVWRFAIPEIRFGRDAIDDLPYQLRSLGVEAGARGALVTDERIVTIGHVDRVRDVLHDGGIEVDVYSQTRREPATSDVDECAEFLVAGDDYEFTLGLGGGSVLDTAKAAHAVAASGGSAIDYVAATAGGDATLSPSEGSLVTIPTTAGSPAEISASTSVRVGDGGTKASLKGEAVRPDATVLDPTFSVTLPPDLTAETLMDPLGGAIESFTGRPLDGRLRSPDPETRDAPGGRTELTDMLTERAITLLAENVRTAVHDGSNLEARSAVMLGTLFAAMAARTASANLAHTTTYAVQNVYHTHHSVTIGVLTPASALGYNVASNPERYAALAGLLGADTAGASAREAAAEARREYVRLQRDLGVFPSGLAELVGITEDDDEALEELAASAVGTKQRLIDNNPRPVTEEAMIEVFRDAVYNWRA